MSTSFRPPAGYPLMVPIVVLTLATAIIHVTFGTTLLFLNGLGYMGLLVLLYAPVSPLVRHQHFIRYVLIAYTTLTVLLWFPLGTPYTGLGYATKAIELILIAVLIMEAVRARRPGPPLTNDGR